MPRRISDDMIAQICDENDIIDYVSRYVQLKKSGRDYSGLCPFHHEKTTVIPCKSRETAFSTVSDAVRAVIWCSS